MRGRWLASAIVGAVVAAIGLTAGPAQAVQYPQSSVVSDDPVNWTPHVLDGEVDSIIQVGDTIVIGGQFTQLSQVRDGAVITRSNLAAFSASTGLIDPNFAPVVDGQVTTVLPSDDPGSIYVGGFFNKINGTGPASLQRVSLTTGNKLSTFKPPAMDGRVKDLRLSGGRLFVAGNFSTIGTTPTTALATLNPTTGALDPFMNVTIAGTQNGGKTQVNKIDISPDGTRLVGIGNFATLNGVRNQQILMLDLSGANAVPANWQTAFFQTGCSTTFDTYMRDVDISPDGTFFVVSTTGGYGGQTSACDSQTRWDFASTGTGVQPTWINSTGGDTTYAVAITATAVYVGGHFRWANNPFASDRAGQGAVAREGLAALDPVNGLPLNWDPGRTRGVGVFDLLATPQGLWVGSDTDRLGHDEYHARIAMLPLAGGEQLAAPHTGVLPGNVFLGGRTVGANQDDLRTKSFSGTSPAGAESVVPGTGIAWSSIRGAFMINNTLYTGNSDGSFTSRSFDGTTFGAPTLVNTADLLVSISAFHSDMRNATGMFFYGGRMYYTVSGSSALYYRYFTPSSGVVGALRFTASTNLTNTDWSRVQGMFYAGGSIYFANGLDSNLRRITMGSNGFPVNGTSTIVSGPGLDGSNWRSRALFLFGGNLPPTASFTTSCVAATCGVDASGSSDADGSIASYAWDFGDGTSAPGASTSHTYTATGDFTVTLTVTDDVGAARSTTRQVHAVVPNKLPTAAFTSSCLQLACDFDGATSSDPDGTIATYAWDFGDGATETGSHPSHTFPSAGDRVVTLTVTDHDSGTDTVSHHVVVSVPAADIAFRGSSSASANASVVATSVPSTVQAGDVMLLHVAANTTAATLATPAGWTAVTSTSTGSALLQVWKRVATAADAGSTVQVSVGATTKSVLSLEAYSDASPTVQANAVTTDSTTVVNHPSAPVTNTVSGSWGVVFWADKSSTTTSWSAPSALTVRQNVIGTGTGRVTGVVADSGPLATGAFGSFTATTDAASRGGSITVLLSPAG